MEVRTASLVGLPVRARWYGTRDGRIVRQTTTRVLIEIETTRPTGPVRRWYRFADQTDFESGMTQLGAWRILRERRITAGPQAAAVAWRLHRWAKAIADARTSGDYRNAANAAAGDETDAADLASLVAVLVAGLGQAERVRWLRAVYLDATRALMAHETGETGDPFAVGAAWHLRYDELLADAAAKRRALYAATGRRDHREMTS